VVQVATPVVTFTDAVEQPVIVVPFVANDMVPRNGAGRVALAGGATVAVKVTVPSTLIAAPAGVRVTVVLALVTAKVAVPVTVLVTVSVAITVWAGPDVTRARLLKTCTPASPETKV
jgi:hypothetical protein